MRNWWLCCLVMCQLVNAVACAQNRSTKSHRLIPLKKGENRPSLKDFMSPELEEMRQEYRRLTSDKRRLESADRQATRKRSLPIEDPELDHLRPVDRDLVERLNQSTTESIPGDIRKEIESLNERFARELGTELSETLGPDKIPFDPNESTNFWRNLTELRDAIRKPYGDARKRYNQAMEAYRNTWPVDSVPPSEWIEKVQPYINPELVRQIADVRRALRAANSDSETNGLINEQNSSQTKLDGLSSRSLDGTVNGNTAHKMLASVISAVDRKGTEWLKSAKRRKTSRRSSWWKTLKARSKRKLATLNRTATEHSNQMSRRRSDGWNQRSGRAGEGDRSASDLIPSRAVIATLALCTLVGVAGYLYWSRPNYDSSRELLAPHVDSTLIRDRESLLQACDHLSFRCFGRPSRFWNHRQVFSRLGDSTVGHELVFQQLSQIYEHARYARDGTLSPQDLASARRLYAQVQDVTHMVAL